MGNLGEEQALASTNVLLRIHLLRSQLRNEDVAAIKSKKKAEAK